MEHNFTPLNIAQFKKQNVASQKNDGFLTVFLILGVLTLCIVAVLLFFLIQKKLTASSLVFHRMLSMNTEKMYE